MILYLKAGDTNPPLEMVLEDVLEDGVKPADIASAASVKLAVERSGGTTVEENVAIVDVPSARIRYDWTVQDVASVRVFKCEVRVVDASGRRRTYPTKGYITVNVQKSL